MHRERRKPAWMLALRALQRLLHTLAMALHPGDACRIIRDHNDNETRDKVREAHLRDLIAVIETGSVRSAARKLGLAQAAVSKNLTALEKSLGVPLLVRSARGVEPTEFGRIVLRRARVIDAELRHLQELSLIHI